MNQSKTPLVSVVIPNWNGHDLIKACLIALKQQSYPNFEIIVVDNGSTDESVADLKSEPVRLVELAENRGFAGGVNAGIQASQAEYVAVLNNDARPDPSWLSQLVGTMEANPRLGAVSAKILHAKDRVIDETGVELSIWGLPFGRGRGEADHGQYDCKIQVFGASGAASLYRRSMLDKIGLFDERFFIYYEDVDLAFRGRLRGYEAIFNPKAIVYHQTGSTSGGGRQALTRYHTVKNLSFLYIKNMPFKLALKYSPLLLMSHLLTLIGSIRHGLLWPHLRSLGRLIISLPGLIESRREIQNHRTVSAQQIDQLLYHHFPPRNLT